MATIAGLYKVHGPNGIYYAVYDPASGRLWTERSEHSARSQAQDAGLELAPERSINHQALMKVAGRDTGGIERPRAPLASGVRDREPASLPDAEARPIRSKTPFAAQDTSQPVLTRRSDQIGAFFAATDPVVPPADHSETPDPTISSPADVLSREVLDEKQHLNRMGRGKNPFADPKPERK